MKKRLKIGVAVGLALALFTLTGCSTDQKVVADQSTDGGTEAEDMGEIEVLDGGSTYVDNSLLWPVLEGKWESSDGRWQAILDENTGITISLDGEAALSGALYFVYLQPGEVLQTELSLDDCALWTADGMAQGEIIYFCHEASADGGSGRIRMEMELPEGGEETITFQKIRE